METLKDIFVPYRIALKLKEIRFDQPCIAYFNSTCIMPDYPYLYMGDYGKNSTEIKSITTAPTYEQVFKWFMEKGLYGNITTSLLSTMVEIRVEPKFENEEYFRKVYDNGNHHEVAREQLILKLIEIYEKQ